MVELDVAVELPFGREHSAFAEPILAGEWHSVGRLPAESIADEEPKRKFSVGHFLAKKWY